MTSTIINNIAQELLKLKNIITDIKEAIIEKGVQSEGKLSKFPEEINSITTGSDGSSEYDDYVQFEYIGDDFYSEGVKEIKQGIIGKNITNLGNLFSEYYYLKTISLLNTGNVTNMNYMFLNCSSLTSISQLDTSKVKSMNWTFNCCSHLKTIPQLNTSNVTNMDGIFSFCSSLTSIPLLDTSNVTNMSSMFWSCESLISIPQLDTSNVTDMSNMFSGCTSLISIPQLDTSNIINMNSMFSGCSSLERIDMHGMKVSFDLGWSKKLSTEEINKIFRNCGQANPNATITLPDTEQAKAADKSIVETKGWRVQYGW